MKRLIYFLTGVFVCIGVSDAAVRDTHSITRQSEKTTVSRTPDKITSDKRTTTARTTAKNTIARTTNTTRTNALTSGVARTAKSTAVRSSTTPTIGRTARTTTTPQNASRPARATITLNVAQSNTFGTGYNTCRDAYFTCMDQFCGTVHDTYRRCICSSRLSEIQSRERALTQASDQILDFKNLNLQVIDKTAAEVNSMMSASAGEYAQSITKDKSSSASQLAGISEVLSKTKNKSLSTQGTLDIAGDINSIWATTDLTGGTNIANLTGESLYNAVHAQCAEMVIDKCPDQSIQTMVVSAYGMYIENDCSILINKLDKNLIAANSGIRATEREMNLLRLENYNAHNSTTINDCIAQVRTDITADTACGTDYVHCLDITGRYLTYETGEPIYSPNFYQLETQVSLSDDILTNQSNRLLVAQLNKMRKYAQRGLDTCRDLADEVWDEFMRQAITEIYQGQHERIRQVKNECLNVVNKCYDEQNQSLKDFSNTKEQLLLGARLELSEQMCREKLEACSNLYGGGPNGMNELLTAMRDITSQQIGKACLTTLQDYTKQLCAVPGNDTIHVYPYSCRIYTPGDQYYATNAECNLQAQNTNYSEDPFSGLTPGSGNNYTTCKKKTYDSDIVYTPDLTKNFTGKYNCNDLIYISCNPGYYFKDKFCYPCPSGAECPDGTSAPIYKSCPQNYYLADNQCNRCPNGAECPGGESAPQYVCCGKGYYPSDANGNFTNPGTQCTSCPTDAECYGNIAPVFETCPEGQYMSYNGQYNGTPTAGNKCEACKEGYTCAGGTSAPVQNQTDTETGTGTNKTNCGDYVGSLYHKMARYALETCMRPSESNGTLPDTVLQDVNIAMDQLRVDMAKSLSQECERLDGMWVDTIWIDKLTDCYAKQSNQSNENTNQDNNTGGDTGDDTDGNTDGEETGDNTGGNTGGEENGDNTGGNTDGNTDNDRTPIVPDDTNNRGDPSFEVIDPSNTGRSASNTRYILKKRIRKYARNATTVADETDTDTNGDTACSPDDGPDGYHDVTGHTLHKKFYSETSANTKWGYCANKNVKYQITLISSSSSSSGSNSNNGSTSSNTGGGSSGGTGGSTITGTTEDPFEWPF